jgi:HEAT repeat protein
MRLSTGFLLILCAYGQDASLERMLDSKLSVRERNEACYALHSGPSRETLQALRKAMAVEAVAPCAARILTEAAAVDLLADGLHDGSPEVRSLAARELGILKRAEYIPALATAAGDPNSLVATSATQALCQYEDRRALPGLKTVASRGGLVASISLSCIAALDGREALPVARTWLAGTDATQSVVAMRILGENGDASDLPALRAVAERKAELMTPQRGFGLMPAIDLSRAAKATIAQIESRVEQQREN